MIDVGWYPGSQTTIGRIIRAPLRLIPARAIVRILQGPLRGKRWIVGSGIHRLWLGSYEPLKMTLAAGWVKPGDTVFDIGANVGIYTLLFSQCVGSNGHVIAFEPSSRNAKYLRKHLQLNRVTNVSLKEVAISSATGNAAFDTSDDPSTGRLAAGGSIQVATTTIDSFVNSSCLTPALIKIDVEGAEVDVLRGGQNAWTTFCPRILLSTHSKAIKRSCLELLAQWNYEVRELGDGQPDELVAWPRGKNLFLCDPSVSSSNEGNYIAPS